MIGQERLRKEVFSIPIGKLSHALIFIGDSGCGKHTMLKEISNLHGLCYKEISTSIDADLIKVMSDSIRPTMYVIDAGAVTEREQNALLKFLEEPTPMAYIAFTCQNANELLPTIHGRCIKYTFDAYSMLELKEYAKAEGINLEEEGSDDSSDAIPTNLITTLITTPGQLSSLYKVGFKGLNDLCTKIVVGIGKANLPNALSILDRLNFKDSYDKYDVNMFIKVLSATFASELGSMQEPNEYDRVLRCYKAFKKHCAYINKYNVSGEHPIELMLMDMWQEYRR